MKEKASSRQLETLRAIYEGRNRDGTWPTLSEIRRALGVSSDQAVLDLLDRLHRKGLVLRSPGKSRSIRLTKEGAAAIGLPPERGHGDLREFDIALALTSAQRKIYESLAKEDAKLAKIYLGALRVLEDEGNPDRLAQSAHSIREVTYHFSNKAKSLVAPDLKEAAKSQQENNAQQLRRWFDPLADQKRILERTVYDEWNKLHRFFVEVSHHHGDVPLQEYQGKLRNLEGFLTTYIFPAQPEIYLELDALIAAGPGQCAREHLTFLLSRNLESFRYFFRNVTASWLPFLKDHGFLSLGPETAGYLSRIACDSPKPVMKLILQSPTSDPWVRKSVLDAAIAMPVEQGRLLVRKICKEKWLQGANARWVAHTVIGYCAALVDGQAYKDALELASEMLAVRDAESMPLDDRGLYHHNYAEFLKVLYRIPADRSDPFIRLLVQILGGAIACDEDPDRGDGSQRWRPTVEESDENWVIGDVKHSLVSALCQLIETYLADAQLDESIAEILDELLAHEPAYSIFGRIKLHFYRRYPDRAHDRIVKALFHGIHNRAFAHEYRRLLREVFDRLSESERRAYLILLDIGPPDQLDEENLDRWRFYWLSTIRPSLRPEEEAKYAGLFSKFPRQENVATSQTGHIWSGPSSPLDASALSILPPDELVRYLINWKPTTDWMGASVSGLGLQLAAAVKGSPQRFSEAARLFGDERLNPTYLYQFLIGVSSALREGSPIQWVPIIDLAAFLVDRCGTEEGTTRLSDVDASWAWIFQQLAWVLEIGLNRTKDGVPFEERGRVWRSIAFCCEWNDPPLSQREELNDRSMEPADLSINTTRGVAFHALFAYVFWCDRHEQTGDRRAASRIPTEAKEVLRQHLDPSYDASLAIRSVYGHYFPWLYTYEPTWAYELITQLFPSDDPVLRRVAWDSYLSRPVFKDVFHALRECYELAIDSLKNDPPSNHSKRSRMSGLSQHLVTAYLFGLDADGSLCRRFFREASPEQRGEAIDFAGRVFICREPREGELSPSIEALQSFCEWRVNEGDAQECVHFGWWVRAGKLDDEWQLNMVERVFEKTGGLIEPEFEVLKALKTLSLAHPVQVIRILERMTRRTGPPASILWQTSELEALLQQLATTKDEAVKQRIDSLVDHFTKLGFESYRSLHSKGRKVDSAYIITQEAGSD